MKRPLRWGTLIPTLMILLLGINIAAADWNKGLAALKQRDYKTAVKEFQAVAKQSPDHAGAQYMLGVALQRNGQMPEALTALQKAVKLDPQNTSYSITLGQTLVGAKEYKDAYLLLKKISYKNLDARSKAMYAPAFGNAAIKAGFPDEAVEVLRTQARTSRSSSLYYSLGYAYSVTGSWTQAFDAFKKAYELDPKDSKNGRSAVKAAISAARRTTGSQKKSLYAQGAGVAEKLASGSRSFDDILLTGEAWMGAEQYSKALGWFEKAQIKQSQNGLVRFYKGQCLASLGKNTASISTLKEALKIGVSGKLRTQIYGQMGYVYDKMAQYDLAGQAYKEAGNSAKVRQMKDKAEKAKANKQADIDLQKYRNKLKALEIQIKELEAIGEVEEAQDLREHLEQLKKQ